MESNVLKQCKLYSAKNISEISVTSEEQTPQQCTDSKGFSESMAEVNKQLSSFLYICSYHCPIYTYRLF